MGNDADILGIVTVRRYDSAFGVGGKQDIAVLCLQFERVERPVKWRKITQQFRKMRHVLFYTNRLLGHTAIPPISDLSNLPMLSKQPLLLGTLADRRKHLRSDP